MSKVKSTFLAVFLLSVVMISGQAWADLTYTVKKGDTLYRISKKYKVGVDAISRANDLHSIKLKPGIKLTIPSKAPKQEEISVLALDSVENVVPEESAPQPSLKTEPISYKVKKGDSLWKIAKKNAITLAEIKRLNKGKTNKLKIGQMLIVGYRSVEPMPELDIRQMLTAMPEPEFNEVAQKISDTPDQHFSETEKVLISIAQNTLGVPYKFGGNSLKAIDCSAYVQMVFNLLGVNLPRSAREQFQVGQTIDKKDLTIGDLVFFQTYASFPSHVGIYLGNNLFVHASSLAKKVTIQSLNVPYYLKRFIGAKRLEGVMNDASFIPQTN